jgi:hypothetical protein
MTAIFAIVRDTLPLTHRGDRLRAMARPLVLASRGAPASRLQCVAALLGLLAMIGLIGLATWHDGLPHSHAPVHAANIDTDHHDHAPSDQPDPSDVLHLAAHAVAQTVDLSSRPLVSLTLFTVSLRWTLVTTSLPVSASPFKILRPPRG